MTAEWKGEVVDSGFTEEEERVYDDAVLTLRRVVEKEGKSLADGENALTVSDEEFKRLIVSDFIKIIIAEQHFQEQKSTEDVANLLQIPVERVNKTREEMIKEVQETAATMYRVSQAPEGNA